MRSNVVVEIDGKLYKAIKLGDDHYRFDPTDEEFTQDVFYFSEIMEVLHAASKLGTAKIHGRNAWN